MTITREDVHEQFAALQRETESEGREVPVALGLIVLGVSAVGIAYFLGKRKGRVHSARIEVQAL